MNIFAVATSAVAAELLKDGRTDHSAFKIPVSFGVEGTYYLSVNFNEAKQLRDVSLIMWDEIIMHLCHFIESLDHTLKDTM